MDERGQVDALVLIFPELHADAVVGDGTNDDIVVVRGFTLGIVAVQENEFGPLLAVVTEAENFQGGHLFVINGTVVEDHISAPPFLWQYSAISATIDWKDCVWQ